MGTNTIDFYGNNSAFVVQKKKSLKKLFNELIFVIGANENPQKSPAMLLSP